MRSHSTTLCGTCYSDLERRRSRSNVGSPAQGRRSPVISPAFPTPHMETTAILVNDFAGNSCYLAKNSISYRHRSSAGSTNLYNGIGCRKGSSHPALGARGPSPFSAGVKKFSWIPRRGRSSTKDSCKSTLDFSKASISLTN